MQKYFRRSQRTPIDEHDTPTEPLTTDVINVYRPNPPDQSGYGSPWSYQPRFPNYSFTPSPPWYSQRKQGYGIVAGNTTGQSNGHIYHHRRKEARGRGLGTFLAMLVTFLGSALLTLLVLRFLGKTLGWPIEPWLQQVYIITEIILYPFITYLPPLSFEVLPISFEVHTFLAIVSYGVLTFILACLVKIIFSLAG